MQTVYNSELQFQEMVTRWSGSTHDDIFDDSYLHARFVQGEMQDDLIRR